MLYFDRYAKLLAPQLNVFRDPRIVAGLMEDVMQARMPLADSDPFAVPVGFSRAGDAPTPAVHVT
jgi:hypothetical protein